MFFASLCSIIVQYYYLPHSPYKRDGCCVPNIFLERMYQCDNARAMEIRDMLECRIKAADYNVEVEVKRARRKGAS